ncbi:MAG: AzlC family ABC transporter permease [Trueperaceae bacterium]|nr:MAG: AzlC family ABC transporter permease [Trueperaceae bacterium]
MAFWHGLKAMAPLWLGIIPFGMAYAVTARSAGLSLLETQLMSLVVFAGGAQFSAAGLFSIGAGSLSLVLTTFLINVRHFLYGLTLEPRLKLSRLEKIVGAYFLTDEAFGVTIASGKRSFAFLLGAELSVFFLWNASTLLGSLLSRAVPDPQTLGVDFIFPLTFLALLIPLIKERVDLTVAVFSGALALAASQWINAGLTILVEGVLGSLIGALWTGRAEGGRRA